MEPLADSDSRIARKLSISDAPPLAESTIRKRGGLVCALRASAAASRPRRRRRERTCF